MQNVSGGQSAQDKATMFTSNLLPARQSVSADPAPSVQLPLNTACPPQTLSFAFELSDFLLLSSLLLVVLRV